MTHYFDESIEFLINTISSGSDRVGIGYIAIGELSIAVGPNIEPKLEKVLVLIKNEFLGKVKKKKKTFTKEILMCITMIVNAVGPALENFILDILSLIFNQNLTQDLVDTATEIVAKIPNLLTLIQHYLLYHISIILGNKKASFADFIKGTPFSTASLKSGKISMFKNETDYEYSKSSITTNDNVNSFTMIRSNNQRNLSVIVDEEQPKRLWDSFIPSSFKKSPVNKSKSGTESSITINHDFTTIILAFKTLGTFDFKSVQLLSFIYECVIFYLEHKDSNVRKAVAITCLQLLLRSSDKKLRLKGKTAYIITRILNKLLAISVADLELDIRESILTNIDSRFDYYLCRKENLKIFIHIIKR